MTKVDQFESAFRAASKEIFTYQRVEFRSIVLVIDRSEADASKWIGQVRNFLAALGNSPRWSVIGSSEYRTVRDLLSLIEKDPPDLICTYRCLRSEAWKWPYTLGEYLDVLTQMAKVPVLVFPHPDSDEAATHEHVTTNTVMAMTDHLTGDDRLVNFAVCLTQSGGTLFLTHVEAEVDFDRYVDTIAKIPTIDTDTARHDILEQLLKEPTDYIGSCREALTAAELPLTVQEIVTIGHHLRQYKSLIEEHEVDLLVLNTKDEEQLAMHGLAYPLAIELRSTPLLML